MNYSYLKRDCWLEIDLNLLKNNFLAIKGMVGPGIKVMPAVKANAYGHGIIACGKELEACGADYLGMGNIDEAIMLRKNGITMPLLIFASNLITEVADIYIKYNLIPTILTYEEAESISKAALSPHPIFIKMDCGRGRLGINAEEFPVLFKKISALPNLKIEGIYSHMCAVDWPDKASTDYARWQFKRFQNALTSSGAEALNIPFLQLANTPASIALPELRMTGICPGRAIWGYSPLEKRTTHPDLKMPMVAWKSRLLHLHYTLGGNFGENFTPKRLNKPLLIGVMAGGISDGISSRQAYGYVLIRGKRVPVASSICLEHTILDLTTCPEAQPGDEVIIFGRQGDKEITMEEVRKLWDRDLVSFWTAITPHVQRIYLRNGKPCAVSSIDHLEEIYN